jgi:hypothetical protein
MALPDTFPPMGATFEKPYMEFEYDGRVYNVGVLVGGHNGRRSVEDDDPTDPAVRACIAHPPVYDSVKGRWVVHVENNLVHINFGEQTPDSLSALEPDSPIRNAIIAPNPTRQSTGTLVTDTTDPNALPDYPIDCEFEIYLQVTAPGLPPLVNREPLRLLSRGLEQWPPAVGTAYENPDGVSFFLQGSSEESDEPIVRILPGDTTVLTEVFTVG